MEISRSTRTCLCLRKKSSPWIATAQYVQAHSALCVYPTVCMCLRGCSKIVLHGQKQWDADWFVKTDFVCVCMHVLVSVRVYVYESLFVYMPASISSRVPCAISTEWHSWWWLCCCDLFHTPGCFPSLSPLQHNHLPSCHIRGNHQSVLLCHIHKLQVQAASLRL